MNLLLFFHLLIALHLQHVQASSFTEPHDHQGIVSPFTPGDPKIALDQKALGILASGKPYQTQIQSGTGGRGLVVQDVDAPTDIVWGRILDYDNYAKMVPKTVESKNYKVQNVKPTKKDSLSQIIYTRMKVGFPVLKLEFFVKHLYYPELNSLTWTLDYSKKSDFNDSCGFWFVIPHPEDDQRTRLFYSVEVCMFDWVPKFVVDFMSTKALTDATAWVKKYSEMEYQKQREISIQQQKTLSSAVSKANNGSSRQVNTKKEGFFAKLKFWGKSKAAAEKERKLAQEKEMKKMLEEAARRHAEEEARKKIFVSWT
eukprot:CAMPEP_0176481150 /NCGR_PEP_ID=MMETSP0200_2-20121128/2662_1 /TAXON_ID=947934 /ORGANISM="Chaetoceros sp., Strain GSL56" /LENGTH=312 /DNA_ID=CAMNT_0017877327 /DNA_START=99 /DNA_END=1033 /DNA_ORIENTATION=-